jgi:hypothetical protein
MSDEPNLILKLARSCAEQVGHLKGKAREQATICYWAGATHVLHHSASSDAEWVKRVAWLLIATRGYAEVERIIREGEGK